MARRRTKRPLRRRRNQRSIPIFKEQFVYNVSSGTTTSWGNAALEVGTRHGIRPVFVRITFSTYNASSTAGKDLIPSVIQVRFYNNVGFQIAVHGPFMCGATNTRTVRLRFPNTGWFSPASQFTMFAVDALCYAKSGKSSTVLAVDFTYRCSLNFLSGACPTANVQDTVDTEVFNVRMQQHYLDNHICTPGTSANRMAISVQRSHALLSGQNPDDPIYNIVMPPVGVHPTFNKDTIQSPTTTDESDYSMVNQEPTCQSATCND